MLTPAEKPPGLDPAKCNVTRCDYVASGARLQKMLLGLFPQRAWASLKVPLVRHASGVMIVPVQTILAISTRIGTDLLETMTAMFNPLPALHPGRVRGTARRHHHRPRRREPDLQHNRAQDHPEMDL